jgi:hypothetical protein
MKQLVLACAVVMSATPALAADYVVVQQEMAIEAAADRVWGVVGADYCAISVWMNRSCSYTVGSGDVGSTRALGGGVEEVMVAKTARSYTYYQTAGSLAAQHYHGTLAVEPLGDMKSRILYTLVYDQETLPADQRATVRAQLETRFGSALATMKTLAEARP